MNHHKKKASVLKENISNLNSKSDDIEKEANKCIEYLKDFEFHIKEMKKIQENQNKKYEKIQIEIGNIIKDVAINKRIKPSKIKSELLKTYEGTWLTSLIEDI